MTEITTLEQIKKNYSIPESSLKDIEQFLNKHQDIACLVLESYDKIRDFFATETLSLEINNIEDGQELFVYIQTSLSVVEAIGKINDFDEQWFLSQLNRTKGLFNFNLRFS